MRAFKALRLSSNFQFDSNIKVALVKHCFSRSYAVSRHSSAAKTYDRIAEEMQNRIKSTRKGPKVKAIYPDFRSTLVAQQLTQTIDAGDLVLVGLEPHMVLKTPDSPTDNYLLANQVGLVKESKLTQIDTRLMSILSPNLLSKSPISLFASDETVGAPLQVTQAEGQSTSTSIDKPAAKVVSWWIHKLISMPLRRVYEEANSRAHELLPRVLNEITNCQLPASPNVIPVLDFVEKVTGRPFGGATVVDYYATKVCLDHYSLEFKLLASYSHTDALLIFSKMAETRNIKAMTTYMPESSFLQDYAKGNLPSGTSESRAIECLRKAHPDIDYIDSGISAELLKLERGGLYGAGWYSWMFEASRNPDRNSKIAQCIQKDKLASIRESFDKPVYCIDSLDAEEVDDGISLEKLDSNTYRIGVHIANPSAILDLKKALPNILPLTTSVYLTGESTLPMLPSELVDKCNLLEKDGPRPSMTMFAKFNAVSGELNDVEIKPLILSQFHNIDAAKLSRTDKTFTDFDFVARKLLRKRFENGGFSFKTYVNDDQDSIMNANSRPDGEVIVTEFMNLANHLVAKYCVDRKIPVLFRSQVVQVASETLKTKFEEYRKEAKGLLGLPWQPLAQRGLTSVKPSKHTGIGINVATRFTSPLRRLDDMITHAQIEAHLLGQPLPFALSDLNKLCRWMQLSQQLSSQISKKDSRYDRFTSLEKGQVVEGIVGYTETNMRIPSEGSARIYLPQQKVSVEYKGTEKLDLERKYTFVIEDVIPAGHYASVVLR